MLLHNRNELPSLPLAHSLSLKESYDTVATLLAALRYEEYGWEVIGDFKVVGFLRGLQGGFTKFPCYLCLWDSRATDRHYRQRQWPLREDHSVGNANVKAPFLVDANKILMPPLHIKLGLVAQFVKALDYTSKAFLYLQELFPKLSEAKVKAGIFNGPQTKIIMGQKKFRTLLTAVQRAAWDSVVAVSEGFLGNFRATNYRELVRRLVENFASMGCRMSLKIHMLDAHLDSFKENLGAYSEEHGERFHQDILQFERRYQGRCNERMLGDYIWGLVRESEKQPKRVSRAKKRLPPPHNSDTLSKKPKCASSGN